MNRPTFTHNETKTAQRGLSLVEIMVAMVIGLILTSGVIQLFLGTKQSYRFNDSLSRVQENARFAIDALNFDIRMAGNIGCTSYVQSINNTLNGPAPAFNPGVGIEGWEANGTASGNTYTLPVKTAAVVDASAGGWSTSGGAELDAATMSVPGSDIVRIWRADNNPGIINSISPGANTVVNVTPNASIQDEDILLLSDCQNADWVQACNTQDIGGGTSINAVLSAGCTPGNIPSEAVLTKSGGQLVKLQSYIYYIGKRNNNANSPPGLYRRPLGAGVANKTAAGTPEEVVEGVESLQVLYGIDTNDDRIVNSYVAADAVNDWSTVLSVQIALLMRASERGDDVSGAITYDLAGTNATATNDGLLRQVFNSTITLRNRVQ